MADDKMVDNRDMNDAVPHFFVAADGADARVMRRRVARVVPWVTSITVHILFIVIGFLIPWTTKILFSEKTASPHAVIADFDNMAFIMDMDGLAGSESGERVLADVDDNDKEAREENEDIPDLLEELLTSGSLVLRPGQRDGGNTNGLDAMKAFKPRGKGLGVSFGGLRSGSNARNIVFIVDASGSMLAYLPIIIDELTRSIDQLSDVQNFGVIFFQDDRAIMVPAWGEGVGGGNNTNRHRSKGKPRLLSATDENKRHVYDWMELDNMNIAARGGSNPIAAIRLALREISPVPDVVFILSTNITGAGEFEVDRDQLLKLIRSLNKGKKGELRSVIKTIQFIEEDPLDTLRLIAEENGGPDGYKVLTREELGL